MVVEDIYEKLAHHLSALGMGYPVNDDLIDILQEAYSPFEAEVALALPTRVIPMQPVSVDKIMEGIEVPPNKLRDTLETMVEKGLLFKGKTNEGETGYALLQVGYGFPQTFFWKGEDTPWAKKMAGMVAKYFNRRVLREAYGYKTKPYRYIPVNKSIEVSKQGVYPHHTMDKVIDQADVIAVAHCPCRIGYQFYKDDCHHPTEVCLKFNEQARFVIEMGLAKEVTKEEALKIIEKTEEAGLVHFVDNASGDIQHNCNCCGCACWNVGNIRRRKFPRDAIMATYFLRKTDAERCTGCGACEEICPVQAVTMEDDGPVVDLEWCIGCGVCATVCPQDAVRMEMKEGYDGELPASNVTELHRKILNEK